MDQDRDIMEYLLGQGGLNSDEDQIARQMQMAQQLRARTANPQGLQHGALYTAASPLEHLASGIGGYKAGQQEQAGMTGMQDVASRRHAMMAALLAKRMPQQGEPAMNPADAYSQPGWGQQ